MESIPCGGQQKVSLIVSPSLTYSLGQVRIATTYSLCLTTFTSSDHDVLLAETNKKVYCFIFTTGS